MNNKDCPFCGKIIRDFAFMESKNFLAIYNRAPILPGHSMIIPKRHCSSMFELTSQERAEMIEFSMITAELLQKVFNAKSFNWTIQEGEPAGQTVKHLHMHIIPRKVKDLPNPGDWYPMLEQTDNLTIDSDKRPAYSVEDLKSIVDMIKSYLD